MAVSAVDARRQLSGSTIWLWHYMHADWQWEQTRAWHEDRYVLAVAEVLDLMARHAEITYFFDTVSEFYDVVARKLGPRRAELEARVREGRIRIVSGQVANCRPNQVGDETFIRNLQIGATYFAATFPAIDLSVFQSVDVAIGHSQMPQVLGLAGFKAYRAYRPHGTLDAKGVPHQFRWRGLDGTEIVVTRGAYGAMYQHSDLPPGFRDDWDETVVRIYESLLSDQVGHDRSPSRQLWLVQGCDDSRPFRTHGDVELDLLGFVEEWRRREEVPLNWSTPVEFSEAVASTGALEVVSGVLDACDCGYNMGNGGSRGLWMQRRANDRRLVLAEIWAAAAALAGHEYPEPELQRLWRLHLTYQAHAAEFAFTDDFSELMEMAAEVSRHAREIEAGAQQAIVARAGGGDRLSRFVFNPMPRDVTADVELEHPCATAGVESLTVHDEAGQALPHQILEDFRHPRYEGSVNHQRLLVRVGLPAGGYRRLRVIERTESAPDRPADPGTTLDITDLHMDLSDARVAVVTDVASGAVYRGIPDLAFHQLGGVSWTFDGPEVARHQLSVDSQQWLENGPLRWRYRITGHLGPYAATVDVLLPDRGRRLDLEVRLEGHWDRPPVPGFVTVGVPVPAGGSMVTDIPFGVEPRDPDNETYADYTAPANDPLSIAPMVERLRPGLFWGRSWVDHSGSGRGITLVTSDGGFYWHKEQGRLSHVAVRAWTFVPGSWQEKCSPTMSGAGVHRFHYSVLFHDGDWREADPQHWSARLQSPPRVVRPLSPSAVSGNPVVSFLELTGPALMSSLHREGDETVVRFYESTGVGGDVKVDFNHAPSAVRAVDLRGNPIELPVTISGSGAVVNLEPWQVVTLKVRAAAVAP